MWFLLFGNKGYDDYLGYIINKCPECGKSAPFYVEQEHKKLTIFFVPTFRYSAKHWMTCTACRQRFEVAEELKPQIAEKLMTKDEVTSVMRQRRRDELANAPTCPGCKAQVTADMLYCPRCGRKLAQEE
jgi:predicted RNA-binding Zn-ribbon protein involved in translation (DUF1610 family)